MISDRVLVIASERMEVDDQVLIIHRNDELIAPIMGGNDFLGVGLRGRKRGCTSPMLTLS